MSVWGAFERLSHQHSSDVDASPVLSLMFNQISDVTDGAICPLCKSVRLVPHFRCILVPRVLNVGSLALRVEF